jgi:hypothetical protein
MQALKWRGPTSRSGGSVVAHFGLASRHRVRKTHPECGLQWSSKRPRPRYRCWTTINIYHQICAEVIRAVAGPCHRKGFVHRGEG